VIGRNEQRRKGQADWSAVDFSFTRSGHIQGVEVPDVMLTSPSPSFGNKEGKIGGSVVVLARVGAPGICALPTMPLLQKEGGDDWRFSCCAG
jgi:hypothetical protein